MKKRPSMTIVVDSLENAPWAFTGILREDGQRIDAQTIVERLPIGCGDYTLQGHSPIVSPRPWIAVERKSPEDCVSTILAFNDRRPRFETQLDNMQQCDCRAVIVEGSLGSVLGAIEARGVHSVDHLRKIVHRTILSWQQRFNVPWIFCDSRRLAELTCYRLFESFWKRVLKQSRQEERKCKAMGGNDLLSLFDFPEEQAARSISTLAGTPPAVLHSATAAATESPDEATADQQQTPTTVSYRSKEEEIITFDRTEPGKVVSHERRGQSEGKFAGAVEIGTVEEWAKLTESLCQSLNAVMETAKAIDVAVRLIESILKHIPNQSTGPEQEAVEPKQEDSAAECKPSVNTDSQEAGERPLLSVLANRSIKGLGSGKMTALCAACPTVEDFVALIRRARTEGGKDWKHMPRGIGSDICTGIVEILDEQGLLLIEPTVSAASTSAV